MSAEVMGNFRTDAEYSWAVGEVFHHFLAVVEKQLCMGPR